MWLNLKYYNIFTEDGTSESEYGMAGFDVLSLPYFGKVFREIVQEVGILMVIPHAVIDLSGISVLCWSFCELLLLFAHYRSTC